VLLAVVALVAATVNVLHANPGVTVRVLVAIPLLLAPGYALTIALFPPGTVRGSERLTIAGGLSVAATIFVGLVLDAVPGGLTRTSWSLGLATVTLGACSIGFGRRRGSAAAFGPARASLAGFLAGAVGLLVVVAALAVARQNSLAHQNESHFTQLWAQPTRANGRVSAIRFGVTNDEGSPQSYRVVARASSGDVLFRTKPFRLGAGRSRVGRYSLPDAHPRRFVTLDLYRGTSLAGPPYRSAKIWTP